MLTLLLKRTGFLAFFALLLAIPTVSAVDFVLPDPVPVTWVDSTVTENQQFPSIINDTTGLCLYYQSDRIDGVSVRMNLYTDFNDFFPDNSYAILTNPETPYYPTVCSYGTGRAMFWYEPPFDSSSGPVLQQQVMLFEEMTPDISDFNDVYPFYNRTSHFTFPPQFAQTGQTAYIEALREVNYDPGNNRYDLFLRPYDLTSDTLFPQTLQFSANGITALFPRGDTLVLVKSWIFCNDYENLSCIEWASGYKAYYIYDLNIQRIHGLLSYHVSDSASQPDDIRVARFDDDYYFTLRSNQQVVKINFATMRFELVADLRAHINGDVNKITPLAGDEYNIIAIEPADRSALKICLYDKQWVFTDSISVPLIGQPQDISRLQYDAEHNAIAWAYSSHSDKNSHSQIYMQALGFDDDNLNPPPPGNLPDKFVLKQNYPNPFNPATNVVYELPKEGSLTVEVFNIKGQKVTTLYDDHQTAGTHEVEWDGSEYASGLYLIKAEFDNSVKTIKSVLLK